MARHEWKDLNKWPKSMEIYRVCSNCGKEQQRVTEYDWMRVVGYSWQPLVGRCKPEAAKPNNKKPLTHQRG